MTPMFLNEAIAQTFVFYQDGSLYRGMTLPHRLLKLVQYFRPGERESAFQMGWWLNNQRWQVVISASPQGYGVWVDMQANVECAGTVLADAMPHPAPPPDAPDQDGDPAAGPCLHCPR